MHILSVIGMGIAIALSLVFKNQYVLPVTVLMSSMFALYVAFKYKTDTVTSNSKER